MIQNEDLILEITSFFDAKNLLNVFTICKRFKNKYYNNIYFDIFNNNMINKKNKNYTIEKIKKLVIKNSNKLCIECLMYYGTKNDVDDILCNNCRLLKKHQYISQKEVLEIYKLSKNDINNLHYKIKKCRNSCHTYIKYLYNISIIEKYIKKNFDQTVENYIDMKIEEEKLKKQKKKENKEKNNNKKREMLNKFLIKENKKENEYTELFLSNVKLTQKWLKEAFLCKEKFENLSKKDKLIFEKIFSKNDYIIYNKNFNVKNRKEKIIDLDLFLEKYKLLREYCHKYNVSIRNDSELCNNYLRNYEYKTDEDAEYVAKNLYEMSFFYEKTDYENIRYKYFQKQRYNLDKYSISANSKKVALQKFLQENKEININEYTYKNILVKNIITIIK